MVIIISFALITVYMLVSCSLLVPRGEEGEKADDERLEQAAAIIITIKGIQNAQAESGGSFSLSDIFANSIFR
jgi:hypothetical protein